MRRNRIILIILTSFLFINQFLYTKDTIKFESIGKFRETLLDPMTTINARAFILFKNIYDTLLLYDSQKKKIIPSLAIKWNYNKINNEWIFELRRNVKFSNGEEFNADTVVLNFKRALVKNHRYRYYDLRMFSILKPYLKDVIKISKYKVKFVLYKNYSPFLFMLTNPIFSIQSINSIKNNKVINKVKPIGTGPFYIDKINEFMVVLKRNENYWGKTKRIKRIEIKYIENSVKIIEDIERERVDGIFSYSVSKLPALKKISYLRVVQKPIFSLNFLILNPRNKLLKNKMFRKALYHLWNPQIINFVYQGLVIPSNSLFPKGIMGYLDKISKYDFSIKKAKKILNSIKVKQAELKLIVIKDDELSIDVYKHYSNILKKVNIKLNIKKLNYEEFGKILSNGDYDLVQSGWILDFPDPDNLITALFEKTYLNNFFPNIYFYLNKKLEKLISKAREETDLKKRKKIYEYLNEYILDNHYIIPIGNIINIVILNKKVKNFIIDDFGNYYFKNLKYED